MLLAVWSPPDRQLKSVGFSLRDFAVPTEEAQRGGPYSWPLLSWSPDQGSDGVAAVAWLQNEKNCNLEVVWDINHCSWNGEKAT